MTTECGQNVNVTNKEIQQLDDGEGGGVMLER